MQRDFAIGCVENVVNDASGQFCTLASHFARRQPQNDPGALVDPLFQVHECILVHCSKQPGGQLKCHHLGQHRRDHLSYPALIPSFALIAELPQESIQGQRPHAFRRREILQRIVSPRVVESGKNNVEQPQAGFRMVHVPGMGNSEQSQQSRLHARTPVVVPDPPSDLNDRVTGP